MEITLVTVAAAWDARTVLQAPHSSAPAPTTTS